MPRGRPRKTVDVPEISVPAPGVEIETRWVAIGSPTWKHGYEDQDGFPWFVDQGMVTNPVGGQGGHTLNDWKKKIDEGGWHFGPTWTMGTHTIQWVWREKVG